MKTYHFETLVSTQDTAKEYLAEGRELPFAIIADIQLKGRGRSGNEWVSQSGNLLTSLVIPLKNIHAKNAGQYSFLTAVALMDCLADYGVTYAVNKWPNDILVDGKKIAGILLESDIDSDGLLNALIIGIGVNLVSAPEGAVCLKDVLPLTPPLSHKGRGNINIKSSPLMGEDLGEGEEFLQNFINYLQKNINIIKQNGFAPIREKWLDNAYGIGSSIKVRLPNETFHGEFTGLDEEGALLVNVDGHPRKVYSGEVFFEESFNMLLAIDIGNTNIVFAIYDGQTQRGHWRCMTDAGRTADEYLVFLSQHFELKSLRISDVKDVIISSVVPDVDYAMRRMCEDGLKQTPLFVGRDTGDLGIKILIDRPSELGADRLVNTYAVHKEYKCAAIVVDFGTATTFDIVDKDGNFCGGVIAPGPNLSLEALHLAAAKLPSVAVKKPKLALAKNTVDAMQSGIFWGYVGLVEKILEKLISELGERPKIIATGGLAGLFRDDILAIDVIDEDLTLKGLLAIYQHIKNQ